MSKKLEDLLGKLTEVMIDGFGSLKEEIKSIKEPQQQSQEVVQTKTIDGLNGTKFVPRWKVQRMYKYPTEWNTMENQVEEPSFFEDEKAARKHAEELELRDNTVKGSIKVFLQTNIMN